MRHYMKLLLNTILIFACLNVFGQETNDSSNRFMPIHILPKFPGGVDSLNSFIAKNIKCPQSFKSKGVVIINFFVESDGRLTSPYFSTQLTPDCDKEAMRVFNLMPKWIPATEFEKPIRNYYYVHFFFNCL